MSALLAAAALLTTIAPAHACMKETAESEVAVGKLVVAKAKDAAGRPERPYILHLRIATCLTATDPEDSVKQTSTMHVFAHDAAVQAGLARLVGKSVRVRGRVFASHTAHHHAPIVMEVAEVANE
jgi:acetyl-CoA carboxylase alpha subunit